MFKTENKKILCSILKSQFLELSRQLKSTRSMSKNSRALWTVVQRGNWRARKVFVHEDDVHPSDTEAAWKRTYIWRGSQRCGLLLGCFASRSPNSAPPNPVVFTACGVKARLFYRTQWMVIMCTRVSGTPKDCPIIERYYCCCWYQASRCKYSYLVYIGRGDAIFLAIFKIPMERWRRLAGVKWTFYTCRMPYLACMFKSTMERKKVFFVYQVFLCLLHGQRNRKRSDVFFVGNGPDHVDSHLSQGAVLELLYAMGKRAAT